MADRDHPRIKARFGPGRRHASLLQGGKLFIAQNPIQERGLLAEWCLLRWSLTGTRRSSSLTTTGTYQPCISSRAKLDFGCQRWRSCLTRPAAIRAARPGCALNSIKRSRRGKSNTYRPPSIDRNNGHPQFIMDALGRANPAPILVLLLAASIVAASCGRVAAEKVHDNRVT